MDPRDDWRRDPRSFQDTHPHSYERPREDNRRGRYSPPRHRDRHYADRRDWDRGQDEYHDRGRDYRPQQRYFDRDRDPERSNRRYSRSRTRSPRGLEMRREPPSNDDYDQSAQRTSESDRWRGHDNRRGNQPSSDSQSAKPSTTSDLVKEDASSKPKKRKADPATAPSNPKLHAQFGIWTKASNQVHGVAPTAQDGTEPTATAPKKRKHSYADPVHNRCLLCRRQLASPEQLRKHERKSKLHIANLKDAAKRQTAYRSLIKYGIIPPERAGPQYVDRAKERRQLHQQPSKPRQGVQGSKGNFKQSQKPSFQQEVEDEQKEAAPSKAAAMMSRMGWSAGQGLGADNSGTAAPIETALYAQGVGLGAAGGKMGDAVEEAERLTKGEYNSKDKIRERFEALS